MELHAKNTSAFDSGGKSTSVFALRDGPLANRSAIRVREVDEAVLRNTGQQERRSLASEVVPAHVGGFHSEWKVFALAGEEPEPAGFGRLLARLEQPLHAHADPEKRYFPADSVRDGAAHPA